MSGLVPTLMSAPAPTLLIVWHSRTGAAQAMAEAAASGARRIAHELDAAALRVQCQPAEQATLEDVLAAQGYLFCAPENLGSVSGAMKEFFDRHYYGALERLAARPYALAISAGTDGTGAQRQLERIATGWRLRAVAAPLIWRNGAQTPEQIAAPKILPQAIRTQCEELGGLMAATLLT